MQVLDFSEHLIELHYPVRGVRFAADGQTLAAVFGAEQGASEVGWWDFAAGAVRATAFVYPDQCDDAADPAFAPDLSRCAAHAHEDTANVDYICLFAPGEEVAGIDGVNVLPYSLNPEASEAGLAAMAFTPDGQHLLAANAGYYDGPAGVTVHRLAAAGRKGSPGRELPFPGGTTALAVSPDSKRFACGADDGAVRVATVASGKVVAGLAVPSPTRAKRADRAVRGLAFSPNGQQLLARVGGRVTVFDVATGAAVATLAAADLTDAAFHPAGRLLMTGGLDQSVRLWDTAAWREVARYDWRVGAVHSVAFAADGLTAAAGGEESRVVVWDVDA